MTDTSATAPSLLGSALWYAEQGLRVFPLSPGSKIPFKGSDGCLGATRNAELIHDWWGRHPDANIGIATGYLVDVVDIDGAKGQMSRAERWCAKGVACEQREIKGTHWGLEDCAHGPGIFAKIEEMGVAKVLTPRPGGMHIYLKATGRGNHADLAPGVDYRGLGGYVVAPPSATDVGTYRFLGTPNFDEAK